MVRQIEGFLNLLAVLRGIHVERAALYVYILKKLENPANLKNILFLFEQPTDLQLGVHKYYTKVFAKSEWETQKNFQ